MMLPQAWLERNLSSWDKDRIVVTPFRRENLKGGSYTFTLAPKVVRLTSSTILDVRNDSYSRGEFMMSEGCYVIQPGEFVHCFTEETLKLPGDVACWLSTHPKAAKLGIDFLQSSAFVPPGSECRITLETSNCGPRPVRLYPGMKAVKGIFLSVG